MSSMRRDLRHAIRGLRKSPGFTSVAVLTLALGIGVNTAIFSIADALIGHPLRGVADADAARLVAIDIGQKGRTTPADYEDWARLGGSFERIAAYRQRNANVTGGGPAERVYVTDVTPAFFAAIQSGAIAGRAIQPGEGTGAGSTAVLAYGFWQRRFGGDAGVLGRAIDVDGRPHTIVGVMARDFDVPAPTDVWLPLALTPAERADRATPMLRAIARLKPSVGVAEAQAEMTAISRQLETTYPATNVNRRAHVAPLAEIVQGTITRAAIFLLLALVAVVLLVACANLAGLQLARATTRQRELALRTALGASGRQIAQLVLVENLVVTVAGGALGLVVASACVTALLRSMPDEIQRLIPGFAQIQIDHRALAFTAALAVLSAVLTGVLPAWRSARTFPAASLKEGRGSDSRQGLRAAFVVGQLAVAFVMLVVSGLFVSGFRGLLRLQDVHDPAHVMVFSVNLPDARYADADARARFDAALLGRLAVLPGVEQAAAFTTIPLSNNGVIWSAIDVEGQAPPAGFRTRVVLQTVSPDFFRLMRVPYVRGRALDTGDRSGSLPVALVNETTAMRYWPQGDAIGKRVRLGTSASWVVVVGVVGDVLYDWTSRVPEATVYLPASQAPAAAAQFAIRVNGDAAAYAKPARAAMEAVDPLLPAFDVTTLREAIRESLSGSSQIVVMMAVLAAVALLIAVIGLYGVVAYLVATRTREFGVRLALGARRADIFRLVMAHAVLLAGVGLGAGAALALMTSRLVRGMVFGAGANESSLWLGVAGLLAAVTLAASYVPARRATRADPIGALRAE
jgi:putative ABC transport system permease protein